MTRRLFLIASVVLLSAATAQAARFTVDDVGSATNYVRTMAKKGKVAVTTTLHEEVAADVPTYNATTKAAKDGNKVSATLGSGSFSGAGGTATVTLKFGKVGKVLNTTFDIGPATLKGAVKGTAAASANLAYYVNALEQRKLKVTNSTLKLGNVLRGAWIREDYNVLTKNKEAGSATYVTIAKGGLVTTGGLELSETTINDATPSTGGSVRLSGRLTEYNGKVKVKGIMAPVASAEELSVGDPEGYKSLKLAYTANVGIASKIQKKPGGVDDFGDDTKMTVLKAKVLAGEQMGNRFVNAEGVIVADTGSSYSLSSKIAKSNGDAVGLASESAMPAHVYINEKGKVQKSGLKNLYGVVGSDAEIVASTARVTGGDISMAWRARTESESRGKKLTGTLPTTDSSVKWLTSDVVKISGTNADDVYALQMTFDNRINLAFDGTDKGKLENEYQGMYIGQLDGDKKWSKAGLDAVGHWGSLAAFLEASSGQSLATLEGAWGVEQVDGSERGKSWAIIRGGGSGIFAVVPEPATIVMMLSATLGAMTYGWRRWSRKSSETVA